jgi:hypothetical protein
MKVKRLCYSSTNDEFALLYFRILIFSHSKSHIAYLS